MRRSWPSLVLILLASAVMPLVVNSTSQTYADDKRLVLPLFRASNASDPLKEGKVEVYLVRSEFEVEIEGALSNTLYLVSFANASGRILLGSLQTDGEGEGEFKGPLEQGFYEGRFELSKGHGADAVQFITVKTSFTIGPVQVTTTQVSPVRVTIEPPVQQAKIGAIVHYTIHVKVYGEAIVSLGLKEAIKGVIVVFTPSLGVAKPAFNARMTVLVTDQAEPGGYVLTVLIQVGAPPTIIEANAALAILAGAVTTATTTTTTTTGTTTTQAQIEVTISTDKQSYSKNETVIIRGQVRRSTQVVVSGASASIQVIDPSNAPIYVNLVVTNEAGAFSDSFRLSENAAEGTYTVFVTAIIDGLEARAQTTFVVGAPTAPSIVVRAIAFTDLANNTKSEFRPGETFLVWVIVENTGVPLANAYIWLQIKDPLGTPIHVSFRIEDRFDTGEQIRFGVQITLPSNAPTGVYVVTVLVSDRLISQGGKFMAMGQAQLVVTRA